MDHYDYVIRWNIKDMQEASYAHIIGRIFRLLTRMGEIKQRDGNHHGICLISPHLIHGGW
jgi:hypothetical protein